MHGAINEQRASTPGGRTRLSPALRREQLLDASAEQVGQHGIELSLDSIADAAGVSPALMRHYFTNRDGMLVALFERDVHSVLDIFQDPDRGDFLDYFDAYLTYIGAHPWAHRLWMVALSQETVLTARVMEAREQMMATTLMKPLDELTRNERLRAIAWIGAVESCVTLWLAAADLTKGQVLEHLAELAAEWGIRSATRLQHQEHPTPLRSSAPTDSRGDCR